MPRAGVDEILLVVVAKNVAAPFASVFLGLYFPRTTLVGEAQLGPGSVLQLNN